MQNVRNTSKFDKNLKRKVVSEIVEGKLFVHEAMEKYYIRSKATVINWLKAKDKYDDTSA